MDTTIVPLISSIQTGPLGVAHLPRLWFKMRAHALGILAEGYRHGNGGDDESLFKALGLDGDAFAAHIAAAPDYQTCENWVRANAKDLSPQTLRDFNQARATFEMPEPRRTEWTARFGLDGSYTVAAALNQLDDWDGIDERLKMPGAPATPFVPAIGTIVSGPLGAMHLPRLWLKHRLFGAGRLPEGYGHGASLFDQLVSTSLGFDGAAFAAYVESESPGYLAAEDWVRAHATTLTPEAIAALNERLQNTKMSPERAAQRRGELGIDDPSIEYGILLNDLDDWAGLHRQLQGLAR